MEDWSGNFYSEVLPGVWVKFRRVAKVTVTGEIKHLLVPVREQNPIPLNVACKSCSSRSLYRHGISRGKQRYRCRDCGSTFLETTALPRMRFPVEAVGAAVGLFYSGNSLDTVGRNLRQIYGVQADGSNVYRWVVRFTKVSLKLVKEQTPRVGKVWVADETVLKIGGENTWFWDIIDDDTSS